MEDSFQFELLVDVGLASVANSKSPVDMKLASYFGSVRRERHEDGLLDPEDLNPALSQDPTKHSVHVLADVMNDIKKENKDPQILQKGWTTAASFILSILQELRTIICGKRKTPTKLGDQSRTIITGVGVFLAKKLGISDATSIALAALVLLTLVQATKNAFCKMDDIQVNKANKKSRRVIIRWLKIKNPNYTQTEGRHEMFTAFHERRKSGKIVRPNFRECEIVWRRGRDSNSRVMVLQTIPLTAWVPRPCYKTRFYAQVMPKSVPKAPDYCLLSPNHVALTH